MASEEIFGARKFSSKTERMVRWRKVIRENKGKFYYSWLAALAVVMFYNPHET